VSTGECSRTACTELRVAVERIGPAVQHKKAASALSALLDCVAIFQCCARYHNALIAHVHFFLFPVSVPSIKRTHSSTLVSLYHVSIAGDTDSNGALDYADVDECVRCAFTRDMLEQQLYHPRRDDEVNENGSSDPPLRSKFIGMDQSGDGYLRFSDFYEHCRVGRFFSGLLKTTRADSVGRESDNEPQRSSSANSVAIGTQRRMVDLARKAQAHSGWQAELEQQQEIRRREWAEAQRRSQDAARSAALAAQMLEVPETTTKQTQTALGRTLASVDLSQYEAGMHVQGYVSLEDLFDADAQVRLEG
jgi:hypothetical protein